MTVQCGPGVFLGALRASLPLLYSMKRAGGANGECGFGNETHAKSFSGNKVLLDVDLTVEEGRGPCSSGRERCRKIDL